jgi:hypothetical protein
MNATISKEYRVLVAASRSQGRNDGLSGPIDRLPAQKIWHHPTVSFSSFMSR